MGAIASKYTFVEKDVNGDSDGNSARDMDSDIKPYGTTDCIDASSDALEHVMYECMVNWR